MYANSAMPDNNLDLPWYDSARDQAFGIFMTYKMNILEDLDSLKDILKEIDETNGFGFDWEKAENIIAAKMAIANTALSDCWKELDKML